MNARMAKMSVAAALFLGVTLAASGAHAQWAVVGAACSPDGIMANSNGFLTCTGGVWVANPIRAGNLSTCNSGNAGYIRWSGSAFEGCNGTSWIQLAGGTGLKVYQADGVTELGALVGLADGSRCVGLSYAANSTLAAKHGVAEGTIFTLEAFSCYSYGTLNNTVYFTGVGCTGAAVSVGAVSSTYYGWCCTGAGSCTTSPCSVTGVQRPGMTYQSYRGTTGTCTNANGSGSFYPTMPFCSDTTTGSADGTKQCLVK